MKFKEIKIDPKFKDSKAPRYASLGHVNPGFDELLQIYIYDDRAYTDSKVLPDGTEYYCIKLSGDESLHVYINKYLQEMEVSPIVIDDYTMMRHLRELVVQRGGKIVIPDVNSETFSLEISLLPIPVLQAIVKKCYNSILNARTQLMVSECNTPKEYKVAILEAFSESFELSKKLSGIEDNENDTENAAEIKKQSMQYDINLIDTDKLPSMLVNILRDNMRKKMKIEAKYHENEPKYSEEVLIQVAEQLIRDNKVFTQKASEFIKKRRQNKKQETLDTDKISGQDLNESHDSDSENR